MPRYLPPQPSLEYLRTYARDLLRAYQAGDASTQLLFAQHLPARLRTTPAHQLKYAHALLVLAREYGFSSWSLLKQHIEATQQDLATMSTLMQHIETAQPTLATMPTQATPKPLTRYQAQVATLATAIINAVEAQDINALFKALIFRARDTVPVREYLLKHHQYTPVIDLLLANVQHAQDRIRFLVAQAMDHYADARCADALAQLLHDPVPRVRWAAIHSLQCGACKREPLQADTTQILFHLAQHDPSVKVRRVATYELGQVCVDARVRHVLQHISTNATDQTVLRNARAALARMDNSTQ